uniref:Uncharacterized protein n=1 Tax=Eptatretus burgeri TaxID=7764 RepID=A0A8C4Q4T0_EPTBU
MNVCCSFNLSLNRSQLLFLFILSDCLKSILFFSSQNKLENVNKPTEQIVKKGAPDKVNVKGEEQNHPASEGVLGESDGDHGSTERGPAIVGEAMITVDGGPDDRAESSDDGSRDTEWTVSGGADAPVVAPDKGNCQRHHNEHHSHGHCHEEQEPVEGVKEVAWMVVFGDGVHSFGDGLVIGSTFTISIAKWPEHLHRRVVPRASP